MSTPSCSGSSRSSTSTAGTTWRLVAQHPTLVRGVPGSSAVVASGDYLVSIAVGGDARANGIQVLPDTERFNTSAQRGAIFKDAPHKAGAELFLSWLTLQTTQQHAIAF